MTDEDRDKLEGRVNRELREAKAELSGLLVKAEQLAKEITQLAHEISSRVERARSVSSDTWREQIGQQDSGIETGHLKRYEKAVDLAAIDALDREIGQAVANFMKARRQKQQLGV